MSRKTRNISSCLNLPRERCRGACEYIITRKGKAKQYCRKKSARLDAQRVARERGRRAVEHAQQILQQRTNLASDESLSMKLVDLTQERARNLAERKRALKINKQRVEAEQTLALERARVQRIADKQAEVEQTLALERARSAAERERTLQLNKQRGVVEKTLAHERARSAAERARAQQLAVQQAVTKHQLSYERARNVAERARAIEINERAPLYRMGNNTTWEY